MDDPLPKMFNLSDPSKIKATGGGVCVCAGVTCVALAKRMSSSGSTLLGCYIACVICYSKRFHILYIQVLYTDCSHIEDVQFLFCSII